MSLVTYQCRACREGRPNLFSNRLGIGRRSRHLPGTLNLVSGRPSRHLRLTRPPCNRRVRREVSPTGFDYPDTRACLSRLDASARRADTSPAAGAAAIFHVTLSRRFRLTSAYSLHHTHAKSAPPSPLAVHTNGAGGSIVVTQPMSRGVRSSRSRSRRAFARSMCWKWGGGPSDVGPR